LQAAIPEEAVEPVNAAEHRPLYRKRERIYPKIPRGRYRSLKWAAMVILLAVYYLLPWVRWGRGLNAPEQAVLVLIMVFSVSGLVVFYVGLIVTLPLIGHASYHAYRDMVLDD